MLVDAAAQPPGETGAKRAMNLTLQDIWNGIEKDQFLPHFQPKVLLHGMELVGVEALMRWNHPEYGILAAGSFLHLVADNFCFDDLTAIMLEKSIGQCRRWHNQGLNVQVSVNLSSDLLYDPNLVDRIEAKANEHGVAHENITIEIAESAVAHDARAALDNLIRIRERGFGLAIDDYGTGYSTREHLERVPASELKIDRFLIAGAGRRPALRTALVSAFEVARELNLKSVAEGVENQDEWALVNELGCDMAQGYLIARPMAGEDLQPWYEAWTADPFL
jgi:EAL domain-containing protein (putative c-di-GMP-specific phosphodiesterase class I)